MKKIKGILVVAIIAIGMVYSSTSINVEKKNMDLASLMAVETAGAKWVWFGCGAGGNACGGSYNCKSVIVSSHRCVTNPYPTE